MLIDAEPKHMVNLDNSDFYMTEVEREDDESTPQPRGQEKKASRQFVPDLSDDDDEEPYQTPITLSWKNRGVAIKRKRDQVGGSIADDGKKKERMGDMVNKVGVNSKHYCYTCSLHCSI